ncbi:MAG: hypothetical protein HUU50_06585 [Candidatus Brocadiae bacterium]|nr:hypothetical protein [Candidatus Brocadiia bacterium]
MLKKLILAVVVVFLLWSALDFVVHKHLLAKDYEAKKELWRGPADIKENVLHVVRLVFVLCFVALYGCAKAEKSAVSGLKYGLLYGLGVAVWISFGTYATMPVELNVAVTWAVGILVSSTVGGLLTGLIFGKCCGCEK